MRTINCSVHLGRCW